MSLSASLSSYLKGGIYMIHRTVNVILIDDDSIFLQQFSEILESYDFINILGAFSNYSSARKIIRNEDIHVAFLDIDLEYENGVNIAEHLQTIRPQIDVVFVTANPTYALESYKVYPLDFITKPINAIRLDETLSKIKNKIYNSQEERQIKIVFKIGNELQFIDIKDIHYFEKIGKKITLYLKDGSELTCREILKNLSDKLKKFNFITINRNVLVPIAEMKSVKYNQTKKTYDILIHDRKDVISVSQRRFTEIKVYLEQKGWII